MPTKQDLGTEQASRLLPPSEVVWVDPRTYEWDALLFRDRVPIKTLWDYLEGGSTMDEFLADFEGVTYARAVSAMEMASLKLIDE